MARRANLQIFAVRPGGKRQKSARTVLQPPLALPRSDLVALICELQAIKGGVFAIQCEQLVVGPAFDDPPAPHKDDAIRPADGRRKGQYLTISFNSRAITTAPRVYDRYFPTNATLTPIGRPGRAWTGASPPVYQPESQCGSAPRGFRVTRWIDAQGPYIDPSPKKLSTPRHPKAASRRTAIVRLFVLPARRGPTSAGCTG